MKFIKATEYNSLSQETQGLVKAVQTLNKWIATDPKVIELILTSYQLCSEKFLDPDCPFIVNEEMDSPRLCAFGIMASIVNTSTHRMCFDFESNEVFGILEM